MKLQNGYGTTYKVKGKRRKPWRVRVTIGWDDNGKQIFKNLGYFKTQAEGLKQLELYHTNPLLIDNKTVTFKEIYEIWSEEKYKKISIFLFFSNFSFKMPCIYVAFATKREGFFVPEKKCHGSSTAFHGISQLFISVSDCFLFLYILRRLCRNEYAGFLFFVFMKCSFLSCLHTEFHLGIDLHLASLILFRISTVRL